MFQLRSNMPVDVGCIYWRSSAEPCISVLTPWYCGITETPKEYYKPVDVKENLTLKFHFSESSEKFKPDNRHAWWIFKELQDKVRADYENRIGIVRAAWDRFEDNMFADQSAVENRALKLHLKNKSVARDYLTDYSRYLAIRAVHKARELAERLK